MGLIWKCGLCVGDLYKGYRWFMIEIFDKLMYCNFCEWFFVRGGYCENCGILVYEECIEEVMKRFVCKVLVLFKRIYMNY